MSLGTKGLTQSSCSGCLVGSHRGEGVMEVITVRGKILG